MKRLVGLLLILSLVLVGCGSGIKELAPQVPEGDNTHMPTPVLPGTEAPLDQNWISPGKVQVANFFLGARAEWPVTIHNGHNFEAEFAVRYRLPDYVGEGYGKAPTDIVQDWVTITCENPALAPRETVEVLIILEIPEVVSEPEVIYWQVTPEAAARLKHLWQVAYDRYYEEFMVQKKAEGIAHPEIVCKEEVALMAQNAASMWILEDVEGSLLVYLDDEGSISTSFILEKGFGRSLIEEFEVKGYVKSGDLREGNWEFWISVKDTTQTEMIQTELCSRWLISMRR